MSWDLSQISRIISKNVVNFVKNMLEGYNYYVNENNGHVQIDIRDETQKEITLFNKDNEIELLVTINVKKR